MGVLVLTAVAVIVVIVLMVTVAVRPTTVLVPSVKCNSYRLVEVLVRSYNSKSLTVVV